MTKEQTIHYLKGGKFTAVYTPVLTDTKDYHKKGRTITVWQNCLNTPIGEGEYSQNWGGQYRFNSDEIYGWFPEEDIKILEIVDEFIPYPEKITKYCYRLTYTEKSQILPNFGIGNFSLPLIVYREYDDESDEYIKKLSSPQATMIEKRVIDLINNTIPQWEVLYQKVMDCPVCLHSSGILANGKGTKCNAIKASKYIKLKNELGDLIK
jgi:hypothetical protein